MRPKRLAIPLLAVALLLTSFLSPASAQAGDGLEGDEPPLRCNPSDNNAYTGYTWKADRDVCVPGLISIPSWYMPAPPYSFGAAVWYAPYIMEGTARYRDLPLEGFLDGVSLMSPSDIGRTVWLRRPDHDWEGPFLVVDSAARGDIWAVITTRKEIVEVGFQTAARWGMVTAYQDENGTYHRPYTVNAWRLDEVEVLKMDEVPPDISIHEPLDYVEWWTERFTFVNPHDIRRPYLINKGHEKFPGWKWMATDPPTFLNAYDDWFGFLFPGDPRFEFDLPDNYQSQPEVWDCVLSFKWCLIMDGPGFQIY